MYPSVPVVVLPVDAIAGGLELGDIVGPTVVYPFIHVGLDVSVMGLGPFGLDEAFKCGGIVGKGILKDQVVCQLQNKGNTQKLVTLQSSVRVCQNMCLISTLKN